MRVSANPSQYFPLVKLLSYVNSVPLNVVPGSEYKYMNTNWILAGFLIEKMTRNSFQKEVTQRIIDKLKLKHTFYPKNLANEYYKNHKGQLIHGYFSFPGLSFPTLNQDVLSISLSWAGPAGAMISNTHDINKYLQALFNPSKIMTAFQIKELESSEPGVVSGPTKNNVTGYYALGIGKNDYDNGTTKETFYSYEGTTLGSRFVWYYFPSRSLNIVMAVNSYGDSKGGDNLTLYPYATILPNIWKKKCF
jgi:D-alanyl-D-alanine carboxypeptidase